MMPDNAAQELVSASSSPLFGLRYPGQYFDAETGQHYNYIRTYDPESGRYTQADPIGLDGGWNRFGYVGGNALGWSDPEGLEKGPASPSTGGGGNARGPDIRTGDNCPTPPYDLPAPNPVSRRDFWEPVCEASVRKWGDWVDLLCKPCITTVCESGSMRAACCTVRKDMCMLQIDETNPIERARCVAEMGLCTAGKD